MTKPNHTVAIKFKRGMTFAGLFLFFYFSLSPAFAAAPTVGTISPASGYSLPNQTITFTTTYSDLDGWQNIQSVYFLINSTLNGANSFYGYYNQNTNKLYLRNDAGSAKLYLRNDAGSSWLGGYAPGSSRIIQNSYVKLNCAKTVVSGSSATLEIKWPITFKSTFLGNKNMYLKVIDDTNAVSNWVKKGTWIIRRILSISLSPDFWNIGVTGVNKVITMAQANKITVTNNGNGPETLALSLVNPSGWTASTTPGNERYVLSGLFCGLTDSPAASSFNQDNLTEDVITAQIKKATTAVFSYRQATANAVAIPAGQKRSLYLQFKSPTITQKINEQNISVIISCQGSLKNKGGENK